MVLAPPAPTPCSLLTQGCRPSQLQSQGSGVTRCGLALKSADPQAPQGDTSPSNCLAQGSSALQHTPRPSEGSGRLGRRVASEAPAPASVHSRPVFPGVSTPVHGGVIRATGSQVWQPISACPAGGPAHLLPLVAAPLFWPGHLDQSPPTSGKRGARLAGGWGGKGSPALERRARSGCWGAL